MERTVWINEFDKKTTTKSGGYMKRQHKTVYGLCGISTWMLNPKVTQMNSTVDLKYQSIVDDYIQELSAFEVGSENDPFSDLGYQQDVDDDYYW